jgi:hypothetical protein
MATTKKPRVLSDEIEYRLGDYRASDYVKTYEDVERIKSSRWKLHEKVRGLINKTENAEAKLALKFALEMIMDDIQALALLGAAKRQLEEPHIAAWIKLTEKVEQLSEELDRVAGRIPEDRY